MSNAVTKRDAWTVFKAIEKEIPADLENTPRLIKHINNTWPFRPPEFEDQNWNELAELVNVACNYSPRLDTDWKIKIVAALMNTTEDAVREQYGAK